MFKTLPKNKFISNFFWVEVVTSTDAPVLILWLENVKNCSELRSILNLLLKLMLNFYVKKASQKLNSLSRIALSILFEQREIIFSSFFISQFSYCPLIWKFYSSILNNRINRLHERALRLVYMDYEFIFEELLLKDNSLTIHQRNLQNLMIKIFKVICEMFST